MSKPVEPYPLPAADSLSDACESAALQLSSDILLFHAAVTIPLGGTPSLISPQLLDSAAHRPFAMFGDAFLYPTGLIQAAALFASLAQNHPFEDGNKRTALVSCLYFLDRCHYWQDIAFLTGKEAQELEALTLQVATPGNNRNATNMNAIAQALDDILGPSKNRRGRAARLRSGLFRPLGDLFRKD